MAKPARPDTHTTTARSWVFTLHWTEYPGPAEPAGRKLVCSRQYGVSSPAETLDDRIAHEIAEARNAAGPRQQVHVAAFAPTFPFAKPSVWRDLNRAVVLKLTGSRLMTLTDAQTTRRSAA